MPSFRKRPETVQAVHFTDAEHPPRGVYRCTDGTFAVWYEMKDVRIALGDWIIPDKNGYACRPFSDADFRAQFEPADPEAAAMLADGRNQGEKR